MSEDKARKRPAQTKPRQNANPPGGLWAWLQATYASADPRSLAVFRILFVLVLIHDVARRWPDLVDHYSNSGWLTNHFAMFRPMSNYLFSLYLAFSTPSEVKLLAAFQILVGVLLLIGWRTRLMQVLSCLLIISLNSRNIMLENGGFVVVHLLAVWSLFLPLGRRFSVDAFLESMKRQREGTLEALNRSHESKLRSRPVISLAVTTLILQFAIIYYFNVVHKTGPSWKDGTAVYYFFQQDRMVTALGAWLRHNIGLEVIKFMTWTTLVVESLIALFLVSPIYTQRARMVGWALVIGLHAGIDSVVQLGPFSYAMIVVHAVFIPTQFWDFWQRRTLSRHGCHTLYLDPTSGFSLQFARVVRRLVPANTVRFAGLSKKGDEDAGQGADFARPVKFAETRKRLLVTDSGGERFEGMDALLKLVGGSIALKLMLAPFRWGPLKAWASRWLNELVARRGELTEKLGLEGSVGVDEQSPQSESARARFGAGLRSWLGNLVLIFFVVCCGSQVLMENRAIPEPLKLHQRPEWMTAAVVYPRLFQGWSMFAPGPPKDDGKIVVEGRTKDGRRFDPLSQSEPDYRLNPPGGFAMNQLWGDFHRRIWQGRFRAYWNGVKDYLQNHHELTGKPEDELVAFEVYYVSEVVLPPGGGIAEPKKERLFSWGNTRLLRNESTGQKKQ